MQEHEHLSTFLKRFNHILDSYAAAGIDTPTDPEQVARFLNNLHPSRFRNILTNIRDHYANSGEGYPENLNQAFQRAATWERDHYSSRSNTNNNNSNYKIKTNTSFHTNSRSTAQPISTSSKSFVINVDKPIL